MIVSRPLTLAAATLVLISCGPEREMEPEPEPELQPERVLVGVAGVAPGIHVYFGPDACRDPETRKDVLEAGDVVALTPLLVDAAGPLTHRTVSYGGFRGTQEMPQPALNEFSAVYFPPGEPVGSGESVPLSEGTFSLDVAPNYDTGSFRGTYDLVFEDGTERRGTVDTRFCPSSSGIDHVAIAFGLGEHCRFFLGEIYAPGSSLETLRYDRARALRTRGLDRSQADCLESLIECCREDADAHGGPLDGNVAALARSCVEVSSPEPIECPVE
jgi:hypothetical protein